MVTNETTKIIKEFEQTKLYQYLQVAGFAQEAKDFISNALTKQKNTLKAEITAVAQNFQISETDGVVFWVEGTEFDNGYHQALMATLETLETI